MLIILVYYPIKGCYLMNIIDKIWGNTSELLCINNVSINRLNIIANSKCSRHYHQFKYNMFYIEQGTIIVHTWENNNQTSITLTPGKTLTISPNVEHQFESITDCIVYEIYYTNLDNNDIIRLLL